MITVAGEALIDVVLDTSGVAKLFAGGGPFNVARTIARLGGSCQFLGPIADDGFGRRLRGELDELAIRLVVEEPARGPTTLAIAQLDQAGGAEYTFYLDGTSAAQLTPADVPPGLLVASGAFVFGGLGIVAEPIASTLLGLIADARHRLTVMFDVNCRPSAIRDREHYLGTVRACLAHVNIVKVSVEDLKLLDPSTEPQQAARALLAHGPAVVLVTDGPSPVAIHTAHGERRIPVPEVHVADTVGAGDAFVAGFLLAWTRSPRAGAGVDLDELASATGAGVRVATAACTVSGANLPENPFPRGSSAVDLDRWGG